MLSDAIQVNPFCQFFVVRKKRYCRMTVRVGQQFCGEHLKNVDVCQEHQRVVCPYDNKHTCYVDHLAKHLKICNARPLEDLPPYIVPGINSISEESCNGNKSTLADVSDTDLLNLIDKITRVSKEYLPKISTQVLEHAALASELMKPENGINARKHLLQNSSLLGHMESSGLIKENTCYIEFGAGKGQLSYWLGKAIKDDQESMLLLVDRASHRHKFDNRKREAGREIDVLRLRADIADLSLNYVNNIEKYKHVVAVSKHLCGAATDLALHCLSNSTFEKQGKAINLTGVVMAFCCHHRCEWNTYTGKEFLISNNFTFDDFNLMCCIASWATCGSGRSRTWEPPETDDDQAQPERDRYSRLHLNQDDRKSIGRQCKLIMDFGRLQHLKEIGFDTDLVYYIDQAISPENLCLIATKI